ncbi:VWA domain-containing protein [Tenacibaculum finnmarkense genomovar ulcerans]|uniref:vWA domain-containing protein n=1 Tax=Tenacibaculum finnmarkense TaxID=2781243 RepID=UPI001E423D09|nr:VWA domain-containing protein [Tenacibaculum finnmarkense]MCD8432786.1 VWA domain-containing protein [Tenacibaculum finnmarkense genomovar ulcerans]
MRRLPVYLLLDTSGSMMGEPIEAVKNGVQVMVNSLRQNPQAIETAFLSIITFDSIAKQVVPLTDLMSFQMPSIQATGTTSLGEALDLVSNCIDKEVAKTTVESKGDWKPLIFIMTDGVPTDDIERGLSELNKRRIAHVVACAAGNRADTSLLKKITETVVSLDTADSQSIAKFFAWVTASIGVVSTKVEETGKEMAGIKELPPPPSELNIVV